MIEQSEIYHYLLIIFFDRSGFDVCALTESAEPIWRSEALAFITGFARL
ncbi:hypothetical protein RSX24_023425 [Paenibacillus sp. ES5-4]